MSSSSCRRTRPGITTRSPRVPIIAWRKIATAAGASTWRSRPIPPCGKRASNSREPIETLLAPKRLAEIVGHLDRLDPLGVLVAELGRGAQPQRIAEWIGKHMARIFRGENGLRVQRGGHVHVIGVVVAADEINVLGCHVGADALEKAAQVHAGPLADIVPALHADVPNDN